jgi:hypothetical protein
MKRLHGLFAILALTFLSTETWGQTSKEYALMGRKLYAAFVCAALTDVTGEANEKNRLFNIGYEQGKIFINAVQSGKIQADDFNNQVPIAVTFLLKGPSVDFILGRIFEAAIDDATKDVFDIHDKEAQKIFAQSKYTKMNCGLM